MGIEAQAEVPRRALGLPVALQIMRVLSELPLIQAFLTAHAVDPQLSGWLQTPSDRKGATVLSQC